MTKIRRFLATFALIFLLILTTSFWGIAQDRTELETPQQQAELIEEIEPIKNIEEIDGFPVDIDGNTVFYIRRGVASFSAEERAESITKRLEFIAENDSLSMDDIKIERNPEDSTTSLVLDREVILTVTPQDAKAYRGTQDELARSALQKIKAAVATYRSDRRPAKLLRSLIYTVLATFILLAICLASIKLSSWALPSIRNWLERRIPGFSINNFEVISPHQISFLLLRVMQLIRLLIILFFIYVYLSFSLSLFPWTRAFGNSILGYFFQALDLIFKQISTYLPNVLIIAIVVTITYYILRFIQPFFRAVERGVLVIPGFYSDWASPTYKIVLIFIVALAAVVVFPYLPGFDSPAFRGISVFLGLLFSLGSTSAIANIVGGVILIYTRAFQVGDRVKIGDATGDIIEKTLLVTRIRTIKNVVITIPNSAVLGSSIVNYSTSARDGNSSPLILNTTITLGYDIPWRKVYQALLDAALQTDRILKEPEPFVLQTSLDDFYISYELNAYTDCPTMMAKIYSQLHQNIQDKCNEVGIEILSPHYSALRDGNQNTIPENYLPKDYIAPGFRLSPLQSIQQEPSDSETFPPPYQVPPSS